MGLDKASLPFGSETMLARVVRLLSSVVQPIVVVTADGQSLPDLPDDLLLASDKHPDRGPLEALYAGLQEIEADVDAVYATSCDVPLLVPAVVSYLVEQLGEHDIAVPHDQRYHHPLSAVYRTSVIPHIEALLAADRLRPFFLFDTASTREVPVDELRGLDPSLDTLANLNRPEDYLAALDRAGFEPDPEVIAALRYDG